MFHIKVFNKISDKGLSLLDKSKFKVSADEISPQAILLRSHSLQPSEIANTTLVVGRAGAGFNNIPVDHCTAQGIPVLTTPGANANAVKEMVLAGMLLGARNICQAWDYAKNQHADPAQYEKDKNNFVGCELVGKTLGLIGLGHVGVKVANAAVALGMQVFGYDPHISAQNAWDISSIVKRANSIRQVLSCADFISIHVPLNEHTRELLNDKAFADVKPGAILLNFARSEIIDEKALINALQQQIIKTYVSDFPSDSLAAFPQVISLPHLGASTVQAQENCAVMIAEQVADFLENGNITHSVNFPDVNMPRSQGTRIAIINRNIPNMLAQISTVISKENINIIDMLNKSKKEIAYTLLDIEGNSTPSLLDALSAIDGILQVRLIFESAS